MEPSEEIRRIIERWLIAARDGDVTAYANRLSSEAGAVLIGTDEAEWLHQAEFEVFRHQVQETGGFSTLSWGATEAWEEGSVGWGATPLAIGSMDDTEPPRKARGTWILHLEAGEWKLVQAHWSFGIPNQEVWGIELPTTLDQLEQLMIDRRPDLSNATGGDGTITLVFTDIVDSTVLTARLGDRAWMDTVRRHHDVIRQTVEAHQGRVVETQGDGSLLAFASARRAVACAKEIQRAIGQAFADASPPIRVRIGIHTGDVLQEGDGFYGTTVNYAARVASHALGDEVLVSSLVHDLLGPDVAYLDSREVELKGLEGNHRLYAVAP